MEQLRALFQQEGNVLVIQQCKPTKRSVAQATATDQGIQAWETL